MAFSIKSSKLPPSEWVKGKMIGSGSCGHIHMAMNKANGGLFVVKSSKSEIGWKFLENEANILMDLNNSRHVVQCLGKEVTHEKNGEFMYNIFLEHIGGGSISDIADKFGGALCEVVVSSYTKQILTSLNYLHEKGIVHCDIKCKNVLLDSQGHVKLADFGCAQKACNLRGIGESLRTLPNVGGTPLWMAPEVLRGEALDHAADIWSLGCTIIEMATGKLPWNNDIRSSNPMSSILKIAKSKEKPQPPENFSRVGLDFLEKCLQRNPRERWTAQELLRHPFVLDKNSDFNMKFKKDYRTNSPASVLDVRRFDMEFSDCEDERNRSDMDESSLSGRGLVSLVSMPQQVENKELDYSFLGSRKPDLETSESWIVVRSS